MHSSATSDASKVKGSLVAIIQLVWRRLPTLQQKSDQFREAVQSSNVQWSPAIAVPAIDLCVGSHQQSGHVQRSIVRCLQPGGVSRLAANSVGSSRVPSCVSQWHEWTQWEGYTLPTTGCWVAILGVARLGGYQVQRSLGPWLPTSVHIGALRDES